MILTRTFMIKLPVYNQEGKKTSKTVTLNAQIFGVAVKPALIQLAVEAQRSHQHKPWAHTKTRSERRGGGAKPWRQKGTGRARAGSRRSPLWRKGGVTFGPRKERNFLKKINRKARRKAILMVLSDRVGHKAVVIVDKLICKEGKTKEVANLLGRLPLQKKPLVLVTKRNIRLRRAARNLPNVKTLAVNSLNVLDLLACDSLLVSVAGLHLLEKTYGPHKLI